MCQGYFDNLALGEYLFDLPRELIPLPQSPEIVAVPEAASKKVFAEPLRLLLLQFHLSDFHGVYIGIFEQVWIHDPHRMRLHVHARIGQALDSPHELVIGVPGVGHPRA